MEGERRKEDVEVLSARMVGERRRERMLRCFRRGW
jgi:hypothetical protein